MIKITSTTLDYASGYLTATVHVATDGEGAQTLYPSFPESDLVAAAKDAGRDNYSSEDVLAAVAAALGEPVLASPPTPTPVQPAHEPVSEPMSDAEQSLAADDQVAAS